MGVLNVTPDSFSDGGRFLDPDAAIAHGCELADEGAAIIDVGGESTRPGAAPVAPAEQRRRVGPVIEALARERPGVTLSIDTASAEVAEAALAAGARMVNDVTALRGDARMAAVVADSQVEVCLMHMQGDPRTMQHAPAYRDVVVQVRDFLAERIEYAAAHGIPTERVVLDPGIGFGKTVEHNLALLAHLDALAPLGAPLLVGTSRKSFLGRLIADARGSTEPVPMQARLPGTIATCVLALAHGASVFRVHDVGPVRDALAVAAATLRA
ncbi:MAG TPA: dihydropteroate synthase [Solirubrobacteraceae bacterium]|jgi:dihydropteroate synthase|nr:dihydropteroate synthase [Solirubrobacteraceae bacterium]